MEKRPFGETGEHLSILGLGGIVVRGLEQTEANRYVAMAYERGVNYFDVAPSYGDAEEKLGPALEPYRDDVFLACKTGKRDAVGSAEELEHSLERLRTDHVDLYQLHGLGDLADVEKAFGPGGALETLTAAKRDGKTRFLGFSAHSMEAAVAALSRFSFDSMLLPINFVCWMKGWGPEAFAAAQSKGVARLALKSIARTSWPGEEKKHPKCWYEPYDDPAKASLAFRWTLSQDVTAAVSPGQHDLLPMMLDLAEEFHPITPAEEEELRAMAAPLTPIFPE